MGDIHRRKSWNSSWRQVAIELNSRYRFSIAIENAKHGGYTSEKLLAAFIGGGVPLYWGNEEVGVAFCERRFLNLHMFDSLDAAVSAVRELDRNPAKYAKVVSSPVMDIPQIEYLQSQESKLRVTLASLFSHELDELQRRGFGTAQRIYERDFFRRLELESRLRSFAYPMTRLLRR